ncbi:MAG: FAD-dependent oxidoreductase [Arenicellales bacterium]|nr:FAD-dependent oxidoreductase [Arenicellales bacterium]MDP7217903.1 FAD-dependent oxidoreductase [Arenicellales bacterium]
MKATDTTDPTFFHKVVDCQWGCPAHTDVPEYIRMIALGRYQDAYLLNRGTNVFPAILGRVCDRPCEPVCRRNRVEDEPVAICRLKRVAADLAGDVRACLPKIPGKKNGKRIACIGAGCASLTVANDLLPLGYEIVMFEQYDQTGGLMRSNIPAFRLPAEVLDDEITMILEMGVDLRLGHRIDSMAALLAEEFDGVFVGTGAPRGKELDLPGRHDSERIHIGIDWLESVAFSHTDSIGENVLIIGVGNTAMDCCRTALRLGGKNVKVMARKPRAYFKASPWELEDAEEERVEIVVNHSPRAFVVEDGQLKGMMFDQFEYHTDEAGNLLPEVIGEAFLPCDDVILAIGQENAFPWIERDLGVEFDQWDVPVVNKDTFESTRSGVFFGGDAAFGPENIIWAVEHGHQAAISLHKYCMGEPLDDRLPLGMNLLATKMSIHEWSFSNDYDPAERRQMRHVALKQRFDELNIEVELGFSAEQVLTEVRRCLNCDMQTIFSAKLCIECDACIDVCPVRCLTIANNGDEQEVRRQLTVAPLDPEAPLYVSEALPQTGRAMFKDENLCVHCALCAERCPTGAWDMRKSSLLIPYAVDEEASRCNRKTG